MRHAYYILHGAFIIYGILCIETQFDDPLLSRVTDAPEFWYVCITIVWPDVREIKPDVVNPTFVLDVVSRKTEDMALLFVPVPIIFNSY